MYFFGWFANDSRHGCGCATYTLCLPISIDSSSFRHVCCLCHPPCYWLSPPPVVSAAGQQSPFSSLACQTQNYLSAHHGPQAEDGPRPQRTRPLLHVWGQHALWDQGETLLSCENCYETVVARTTLTPLETLWLTSRMASEWSQR